MPDVRCPERGGRAPGRSLDQWDERHSAGPFRPVPGCRRPATASVDLRRPRSKPPATDRDRTARLLAAADPSPAGSTRTRTSAARLADVGWPPHLLNLGRYRWATGSQATGPGHGCGRRRGAASDAHGAPAPSGQPARNSAAGWPEHRGTSGAGAAPSPGRDAGKDRRPAPRRSRETPVPPDA